MVGFNKVILIGNLTRDPELRYTPSGTPVVNFPLAVNRRYRQADDQKEEVCYVDIVVFGRQAEHCGQYLNKGDGAIVDGRLVERPENVKQHLACTSESAQYNYYKDKKSLRR
ncbi:MAG: single-stranded DNA-binding protein, partial [Nitrospirae bacterium]|nr:single-stranded DNA-binding protein [Nitrospirota bacterium]